MEGIKYVWVLSTLYENGKYEVNGVFESEESAKHLQEFMKIHSQDADDGYVIVESKISNFIVLK